MRNITLCLLVVLGATSYAQLDIPHDHGLLTFVAPEHHHLFEPRQAVGIDFNNDENRELLARYEAGAIPPSFPGPLPQADFVAAWQVNGQGQVTMTFIGVGEHMTDEFGYSIASDADITGDGLPDIAIGAPGWSGDRGKVYLCRAGDGAVFATLEGQNPGDRFGAALCLIPDINGNGFGEIMVGAPGSDTVAQNAGRVYVFDGGDQSLIRTYSSSIPNAAFGTYVSGTVEEEWQGNTVWRIIIGSTESDGSGGVQPVMRSFREVLHAAQLDQPEGAEAVLEVLAFLGSAGPQGDLDEDGTVTTADLVLAIQSFEPERLDEKGTIDLLLQLFEDGCQVILPGDFCQLQFCNAVTAAKAQLGAVTAGSMAAIAAAQAVRDVAIAAANDAAERQRQSLAFDHSIAQVLLWGGAIVCALGPGTQGGAAACVIGAAAGGAQFAVELENIQSERLAAVEAADNTYAATRAVHQAAIAQAEEDFRDAVEQASFELACCDGSVDALIGFLENLLMIDLENPCP